MMGSAVEIVLASAGTGKTFQLTNRYLALLAADPDGDGASASSRILATTFTRKAAGEIRDRVLSRLAAAASDPAASLALSEQIGVPISQARAADLLAAVGEAIGRLRIMTIDSFFVGMVLRSAAECGLPAGWRLCDIEEDLELRASAIDSVLSEGDAEVLFAFLHVLHSSGYGRSVHEQIAATVGSAYDAFVATRDDPEAWGRVERGAAAIEAEWIQATVESIASLNIPLTKGGTERARWRSSVNTAIEQIRERDWEGLLSAGIPAKVASGELEFDRVEIPGDHEALWQRVIEAGAGAIRAEVSRRNQTVYLLMQAFHDRYWRAKRVEGAYSFADMPQALLAADRRGDLLDLRYQIDGAIDHVLLDEFQDTSIEQFTLLRGLLDEIVGGGAGRSLFIVGDVKQSLYGWRNAERDLLPGLKASLWPEAQQRTMSRSYRSSQAVLDAVNSVFRNLADCDAIEDGASKAEWASSFDLHESAESVADLGGEVRVVEVPKNADPELAIRDTVAACVERWRGLQPAASIGVLVRRTKLIPGIVDALRARGIDAVQEGGGSIADSVWICTVLAALHLADHPGDSVSLYRVALSPIGSVLGIREPTRQSCGEAASKLVRDRLTRDGYERTIRWMVDASGFGLGEADRSRSEQLLELAAEFELRVTARASDFVELVERRRVERPASGSVRVMTVHGAKGLEFDCVAVADLDKKWSLRGSGVITRRPDVFGAVDAASVYPSKAARLASGLLADMHQAAVDRHVSEELSVLYVAMTRAKHALELIVQASGPEEMAASALIKEALVSGSQASGPLLHQQERGDWVGDVAERSERAGSAPYGAVQEVEWRIRPDEDGEWERPSGASHSVDDATVAVEFAREQSKLEGTVCHAWMEQVEWIDRIEMDEARAIEAAVRMGLSSARADSLFAEWSGWIKAEPIAAALRKPAGGSWDACESIEVWNEWGYVYEKGFGRTAVGTIDRLVVGARDGAAVAAWILDFKTDHGESEVLKERYAEQIGAYREAVGAALRLSGDQIRCSLVLLRTGEVVDLP